MRYGAVVHYAIRKNAGENINGEPEAETQEPRRASPPPASSLCCEHSPSEPHPSHIYPSVSHKGNTNVLNMQDIQRKTIGLVAQSMLSAMIFTAFTASISRNDAVTFCLSPHRLFGEYHHLICLCDTTCIDHPAQYALYRIEKCDVWMSSSHHTVYFSHNIDKKGRKTLNIV